MGGHLNQKELGEQKLNKVKALAILSSDALSSVAYGPEQVLIVLATIGMIAFWYSIPIGIGVLILLTALILSYRQIIYAYPEGGGAYVVSKHNLGENAGLIAGRISISRLYFNRIRKYSIWNRCVNICFSCSS